MNLAIRSIDARIAHGDTFHNDRHPDLRGCPKTPSPLAGEGWGGGLFFNGLDRQRLSKNASQGRLRAHRYTLQLSKINATH